MRFPRRSFLALSLASAVAIPELAGIRENTYVRVVNGKVVLR